MNLVLQFCDCASTTWKSRTFKSVRQLLWVFHPGDFPAPQLTYHPRGKVAHNLCCTSITNKPQSFLSFQGFLNALMGQLRVTVKAGFSTFNVLPSKKKGFSQMRNILGGGYFWPKLPPVSAT